ncbi:G5 domain-containing protein [Streptococcus rifensis]
MKLLRKVKKQWVAVPAASATILSIGLSGNVSANELTDQSSVVTSANSVDFQGNEVESTGSTITEANADSDKQPQSLNLVETVAATINDKESFSPSAVDSASLFRSVSTGVNLSSESPDIGADVDTLITNNPTDAVIPDVTIDSKSVHAPSTKLDDAVTTDHNRTLVSKPTVDGSDYIVKYDYNNNWYYIDANDFKASYPGDDAAAIQKALDTANSVVLADNTGNEYRGVAVKLSGEYTLQRDEGVLSHYEIRSFSAIPELVSADNAEVAKRIYGASTPIKITELEGITDTNHVTAQEYDYLKSHYGLTADNLFEATPKGATAASQYLVVPVYTKPENFKQIQITKELHSNVIALYGDGKDQTIFNVNLEQYGQMFDSNENVTDTREFAAIVLDGGDLKGESYDAFVFKDFAIKFTDADQEDFYVRGAVYQGKVNGIQVNNANNVTVDGVEVSGANRSGVYFTSSPNTVLIPYTSDGKLRADREGFTRYDYPSKGVSDQFRDNERDPSEYHEVYDQLHFNYNNKVINSHLHDNRVSGVTFAFQNEFLAEGNLAERNGHEKSGSTGYGIASSAGSANLNIVFRDNTTINNYRKGLDFHDGDNILVENNTSIGDRLSGIAIYNRTYPMENVTIRNNVITQDPSNRIVENDLQMNGEFIHGQSYNEYEAIHLSINTTLRDLSSAKADANYNITNNTIQNIANGSGTTASKFDYLSHAISVRIDEPTMDYTLNISNNNISGDSAAKVITVINSNRDSRNALYSNELGLGSGDIIVKDNEVRLGTITGDKNAFSPIHIVEGSVSSTVNDYNASTKRNIGALQDKFRGAVIVEGNDISANKTILAHSNSKGDLARYAALSISTNAEAIVVKDNKLDFGEVEQSLINMPVQKTGLIEINGIPGPNAASNTILEATTTTTIYREAGSNEKLETVTSVTGQTTTLVTKIIGTDEIVKTVTIVTATPKSIPLNEDGSISNSIETIKEETGNGTVESPLLVTVTKTLVDANNLGGAYSTTLSNAAGLSKNTQPLIFLNNDIHVDSAFIGYRNPNRNNLETREYALDVLKTANVVRYVDNNTFTSDGRVAQGTVSYFDTSNSADNPNGLTNIDYLDGKLKVDLNGNPLYQDNTTQSLPTTMANYNITRLTNYSGLNSDEFGLARERFGDNRVLISSQTEPIAPNLVYEYDATLTLEESYVKTQGTAGSKTVDTYEVTTDNSNLNHAGITTYYVGNTLLRNIGITPTRETRNDGTTNDLLDKLLYADYMTPDLTVSSRVSIEDQEQYRYWTDILNARQTNSNVRISPIKIVNGVEQKFTVTAWYTNEKGETREVVYQFTDLPVGLKDAVGIQYNEVSTTPSTPTVIVIGTRQVSPTPEQLTETTREEVVESLPFEKITVLDDTMDYGTSLVTQPGVNGQRFAVYRQLITDDGTVIYEDVEPSSFKEVTSTPEITRVGDRVTSIVSETTSIDFDTEIRYDDSLPYGEENEVRAGQPGQLIEYFNAYSRHSDGTTISQDSVPFKSERTEPVSRIIVKGTYVENEIEKTQVIQYDTLEVPSNDLPYGTRVIQTPGENGERKLIYLQRTNGYTGEIISTTTDPVREQIIKAAKSAIVLVGTYEETTRTETKPIPFEIEFINSDQHPVGTQIIQTPGQDGTLTLLYTRRVNRNTGELISEALISETVTPPVTQVVLVGTKPISNTRVEEFEISEEIDFDIEYQDSDLYPFGTEVEGTPGQKGRRISTYTRVVDTTTGQVIETSTVPIRSVVTLAPTNKIVYKGTYVEETVSETEVIPYKTVRIYNPNLAQGTQQIKVAGQDGEKTLIYKRRVNALTGDLISVDKTSLIESVTREPVDEVLEIGTHRLPNTTNTVIVIKEVPFDTNYIYTPDLNYGNNKIVIKGKPGKVQLTYDANTNELLSTVTLEESVTEVIYVGTRQVNSVSEDYPVIPSEHSYDASHTNNTLPATGDEFQYLPYLTLGVLGLLGTAGLSKKKDS